MVTAAMRGQLQRVRDGDGVLALLRLSHPGMTTAYIVNDTRDWTVAGQVHVGLAFRFTLPAATAGQAPRGRLEIDNVGRALVDELEALPLNASLLARLQLVSRARLSDVEYSFECPLSQISATVGLVTATMGNDDAWRAPAVKMRYDQVNSPGLFAG